MLKVLQLIPTLDRSGAEKQMVLLARGLPRDRFRVEVAALTRLGPLEAELRDAGIPVTLIGKRLKVDPLALARLVRFLKAGRFDVVQTWIFAANTYGRVAARLAGVPVVVTAEMAVDLWKGRGELAIDRRLAPWTDRVVGNSHAVVDFYRKAGVPDDRLAMIHSGIGDEEPPAVDPAAVRAEFGWPADAPLVLFAGRLAAQKGVDDLLAALDLLQHVRPDAADPDRRRRPAARPAGGDGARLPPRRQGPVPRPPRRRPAAAGRRRPARPAQPLRGPAQRRARGDAVPQAGRRHRRAGDDRGRRRRRDRPARPAPRPSALAQAIRDLVRDPDLARRLGEAGRARVEAEFAPPP